jgi:hypothetical protein
MEIAHKNSKKFLNPLDNKKYSPTIFVGKWENIQYYFVKYTSPGNKNKSSSDNIISISFFVNENFSNAYFKTKGIPNSERDKYLKNKVKYYNEGLEDIIKLVKKVFPTFNVRIYCDISSIYLLEKYLTYDNVELYYFYFPQFFNKKTGFHFKFFATLIRYLPLFDFKEHMAKVTCILDVDINFRNLIDLIKHFLKNNRMKLLFRYRPCNKTLYRVSAQELKHPYNIISSFLMQRAELPQNIFIKYLDDCLIQHCEHYQKYLQKRYKKQNVQNLIFDYGVDEYFLNNTYIEYFFDHHIPINLAIITDDSYQGLINWMISLRDENISDNKDINEFLDFLYNVISKNDLKVKTTKNKASYVVEYIYDKNLSKGSFSYNIKKQILDRIGVTGYKKLMMHPYLYDCLLENLDYIPKQTQIITIVPQKDNTVQRYVKKI